MASSYFFRLGRVKALSKGAKCGVIGALRHNKRMLPEKGSIDPTRTLLNYALAGDDAPEKIDRTVKATMIMAGIEKPAKNQVLAVEAIFSLPANQLHFDTRPFFEACYAWTLKSFDGDIFSFDVHLDEGAPHAHALILPLVDGRMQGSAMIGNIGNLNRLRNSFYLEVGMKFGLTQTKKHRLTTVEKQRVAKNVVKKLKDDPATRSSVWMCFLDAINNNPLPFAQMLSIELGNSNIKNKSFVDYKRSKGKGVFVR